MRSHPSSSTSELGSQNEQNSARFRRSALASGILVPLALVILSIVAWVIMNQGQAQ